MADPKGVIAAPVAFRADGSIHALELDNSDRLKVIIDAITAALTVTQTTPANLLTGVHGWDGAAWQKLLVDAASRLEVTEYIRTVSRGLGKAQLTSNTALAAGTNNIDGAAVPAGHVWVIKRVSCRYVGTIAGVLLQPQFVIGGAGHVLTISAVVTSNISISIDTDFPLQAGDNVRLTVTGATLNDDAHMEVFYEDLS